MTHLARPPAAAVPLTTPPRGVVLCPGILGGPSEEATYRSLADTLALATGWAVLGVEFSGEISGWFGQLRTAVDEFIGAGEVSGVWLAGFGVGGALAVCLAGEDERTRGVASFAAPLEVPGEPAARPLEAIGKIPPRPILIVHGADDIVVPLSEARALADAAGGEVEMRILTGASHGLRHDPRAVATLQGWLDRQEL